VSTVPEIIDAVNRLNEEQKGQFLAKLADINFDDAWDREMEADAKAGRLDFLWDEAKREVAEGKTRPLDVQGSARASRVGEGALPSRTC
jgi:hypothetical protein